MRRIRSGCCARADSGHAAAPPISLMKSRRLKLDPRFPGMVMAQVAKLEGPDVRFGSKADINHCYSITSLAWASSDGGKVRPSVLAVLRLITSSYLVGACTGRSPGFSPLRMRST